MRVLSKNKLLQKNKAPLIITDTPTKPFEKCALDIVGPLTVTNNGNKYLLSFQDNLTKFSKAILIAIPKASTINSLSQKSSWNTGYPTKF